MRKLSGIPYALGEIFSFLNNTPTRKRKRVIATADEIYKLLTEPKNDKYEKRLKHYLRQYKIRRKRIK